MAAPAVEQHVALENEPSTGVTKRGAAPAGRAVRHVRERAKH